MSSLATDPSALPDPQLVSLLDRLEREERTVSRRRTALHARIDFLRTGGFAAASPEGEDLPLLLATEAQLSDRRLELHRQIDDLRAERSRRRGA